MILSDLSCSKRIEMLHPLFPILFEYVKSHDLLHSEESRIELKGEDLFINNVNPTCVSKEEQPLEAHNDYIDVHILLEGEETIGWKHRDDCKVVKQEYDKEGDCILFDEPAQNYVTMHHGQFMIVYPEDAHAPVIGSGKIRKLIAKVRLF